MQYVNAYVLNFSIGILLLLVKGNMANRNGGSNGQSRPYLHSNLARSLYDRMLADERLRKMDMTGLYSIGELAVSEDLVVKFVQLGLDDETQAFLDGCLEKADWTFTQIWHSLAKSFLGLFMTQTSINGVLSRGRMFVFSHAQAQVLLHGLSGSPQYGLWAGDRILDLGAGDGHVTQVLAAGAQHIDATETSYVMRRRLQERGYKILDTWNWMDEVSDVRYDLISCLNLLDRCDTPLTLLKSIHSRLADHGILLVALVLPFSPFVETGSADNLPSEEIGVNGTTFEEQVNSFAKEIFPNLGFTVRRWSKLPYFCEGDLDQAFYWLTDVVFVLEKSNLDIQLDNVESNKSVKLNVEL